VEEFPMAQHGYNPALCQLNSCLDLGFIAWFLGGHLKTGH
jgi:hypothetical protein